ncbi:MAG: sulfatase-like hydrolase/transferase [Sphingorhabdus sp.]
MRPRARFAQPQSKRHNILLVVSDQEFAWDLYPAGFIDKHTPARAWLRENGVTFTQAQTPTPICSTARGVIYTGAHSPTNMLWDNVPLPYASPLRPDIPTLGSMMLDAGYVTGYAGKWHLSMLDEQEPSKSSASSNAEIKSYGFIDTEAASELDGPLAGYLYDKRTVDQALRFVDRNKGGDKPWFQAVNLVNPHDIMYYTSGDAMTKSRIIDFPDKNSRPPEDPIYQEDLGYELTSNYGPATFGKRPDAVSEFGKTFEGSMGALTYDDLDAGREMQNYYWNCTRDCDRHLMRLIEGLRSSGELERTIIVFTSDHGEILGTHGLRGKGTSPIRESVRVPLTIVHPDGPKAVKTDALVTHIDLAPTLMAFAGIEPDDLKAQLPSVVGRDYSDLVDRVGNAAPRGDDGILYHWTSFAYLNHQSLARFGEARKKNAASRTVELMSMLRENTWKRGLMRGSSNGRYKFARYFNAHDHQRPQTWEELTKTNDLELYDLITDPGETNNLAANPQAHRDVILAMNTLTNKLAAAEIGPDSGKHMPIFARL